MGGKFLSRPLPFVFPLIIAETPGSISAALWVLLRLRKVHADDRDIRTSAYLNPIKVKTVKKLLGSCVSMLDLAADFVLLRGDDGVAATSRLFQTFAIEKPDATANRFD